MYGTFFFWAKGPRYGDPEDAAALNASSGMARHLLDDHFNYEREEWFEMPKEELFFLVQTQDNGAHLGFPDSPDEEWDLDLGFRFYCSFNRNITRLPRVVEVPMVTVQDLLAYLGKAEREAAIGRPFYGLAPLEYLSDICHKIRGYLGWNNQWSLITCPADRKRGDTAEGSRADLLFVKRKREANE